MKLRVVYLVLLLSPIACTSEDDSGDKQKSEVSTSSFSIVDQFYDSSNTESSTWSFRSKSDYVRDGNYTLVNDYGLQSTTWDPAVYCWTFGYAGFCANNSGAPINFIGNAYAFQWPDATLAIHPPQNGLSIVSWLCPRDGTVNLQYSFDDIDPNGLGRGGSGIKWFVDLGASSGSLDSGLISEGEVGSGMLALRNISVMAGDRINFIVDPNDDFHFDTTGFTAKIDFVN